MVTETDGHGQHCWVMLMRGCLVCACKVTFDLLQLIIGDKYKERTEYGK